MQAFIKEKVYSLSEWLEKISVLCNMPNYFFSQCIYTLLKGLADNDFHLLS